MLSALNTYTSLFGSDCLAESASSKFFQCIEITKPKLYRIQKQCRRTLDD